MDDSLLDVDAYFDDPIFRKRRRLESCHRETERRRLERKKRLLPSERFRKGVENDWGHDLRLIDTPTRSESSSVGSLDMMESPSNSPPPNLFENSRIVRQCLVDANLDSNIAGTDSKHFRSVLDDSHDCTNKDKMATRSLPLSGTKTTSSSSFSRTDEYDSDTKHNLINKNSNRRSPSTHFNNNRLRCNYRERSTAVLSSELSELDKTTISKTSKAGRHKNRWNLGSDSDGDIIAASAISIAAGSQTNRKHMKRRWDFDDSDSEDNNISFTNPGNSNVGEMVAHQQSMQRRNPTQSKSASSSNISRKNRFHSEDSSSSEYDEFLLNTTSSHKMKERSNSEEGKSSLHDCDSSIFQNEEGKILSSNTCTVKAKSTGTKRSIRERLAYLAQLSSSDDDTEDNREASDRVMVKQRDLIKPRKRHDLIEKKYDERVDGSKFLTKVCASNLEENPMRVRKEALHSDPKSSEKIVAWNVIHSPHSLLKKISPNKKRVSEEPGLKYNGDSDGDLWNDSEEDVEEIEENDSDDDTVCRVKMNGKSRNVNAEISIKTPEKKAPPTRKPANNWKQIKEACSYEDKTDEEIRALMTDDQQCLSGELKPDFDRPKLGAPGPLISFVLCRDSISPSSHSHAKFGAQNTIKSCTSSLDIEQSTHNVPASINRYLQDYQRTGIQFMYSAVILGKGCILGDDMGLGKTVQVISLIAALLGKTGTGIDRLAIRYHHRKVEKAILTKDESKRKALMRGTWSSKQSMTDAFEGIQVPDFAPILIVVPPSVVQNWLNEFETWGHFNVSIYSGNSRENAIDDVLNYKNFILVTGKSLFTRAQDFSNFLKIRWKLVIIDEFHEYKNHKSQSFKCLERIRDQMKCPLIGMTGTLMQNNHEELYTLIDLVRPHLLEDRSNFMEYTSRPIKLARTKDAKDDIKRIGKQREEQLMKTIAPVYLERKKDIVLKNTLTQKNEKVIFCELSELQKKLYRHILSLPDYYMLRTANAPCEICGINQQYFIGYKKMKTIKEQLNYQRRHKNELVPNKRCCRRYPRIGDYDPNAPIDPNAILWIQKHTANINDPSLLPDHAEIIDGKYIACPSCSSCIGFTAMSKLHRICSHPSLLQVDRATTGPEAEKKLQFAKIAFPPDLLCQLPGGDYYRSDGIMDDHLKLSGKMKTLDFFLRKFQRKRDRVLLFSYSTATLDLIQQHIKTQGWTHLRLDGQTPGSTRQSLVDKFQKDETIFLFLISTKAGGLGLNLTAANKVIIFDVNWNPSYDEQAQDRSFRIGQKNDVEVLRLVARGTIEELMYTRQVYKVQLKKQTLGGNIDGSNQPQIFRGVDKDRHRKGELFGYENLLKFRDGTFMELLWKKKVGPNDTHDISELSCFTEEDLNRALEGDEMIVEKKKAIEFTRKSDNVDDDTHINAIRFNHEDLFHDDRGRARIALGDDEFEDEMGGVSQIIQVVTKLACEKFDDNKANNDESICDMTAVDFTYHSPKAKREGIPLRGCNLIECQKSFVPDAINTDSTFSINTCSSTDLNKTESKACSLTDENLNEDLLSERHITHSGPEDKSIKKTMLHDMSEEENTCLFKESSLRTQPSIQTSDQQAPSITQRNQVINIMGISFENSNTKKDGQNKHALFIPSYIRNK